MHNVSARVRVRARMCVCVCAHSKSTQANARASPASHKQIFAQAYFAQAYSRKQILAQAEDRASLAQANLALASRKQILVAGLIS